MVNRLNDEEHEFAQLVDGLRIVSPERIAPTLPYEWNSLEYFERGKTCLIHYADMPTRPWVSSRNRYKSLWYETLKEAVADGFIRSDEVYEEVERGHIFPELPKKIGLPAHKDHKRLVRSFICPSPKL
jgi:hypothetical protein